jgi:hypothetical protein
MPKDPGSKTFKKITNNEIYVEIKETKEHVLKLSEGLKFNRKWMYGLSSLVMALVVWAIGVSAL